MHSTHRFAYALLIFGSQELIARADLDYRSVAVTGMQAPGNPVGVTFSSFSTAVLNADGETAFRANLSGPGVTASNDSGIWSEGSAALVLTAREGSQAPATPAGANFNSFAEPLINSVGQTAFHATLQTTGGGVTTSNDSGIWSERSGPLGLVVREGNQAPGTPAGAIFSGFNSFPVFNDAGHIAFMGVLQTGSGGVVLGNERGIWSDRTGSLALIARTGSQAPGVPAGANYSSLDAGAIDASGKIAINGFLQTGGGGVTSSNDHAIWSDASGTFALVAREGSQAPGTPAGANFAGFTGGASSGVFSNTLGRTAFTGSLQTGSGGVTSSNDGGIWSAGSGTLSLIARDGNQAPGTSVGAVFSSLGLPDINVNGHVAFTANLETGGGGVTSSNNSGVWSNASGSLSLIAREGNQAPGTPAGVLFSLFNGAQLNSSGAIAFLAGVAGAGVDSTNDQGIWAHDTMGTLTKVVREGDQFAVAPSDLRTISSIALRALNSRESGKGMWFNNEYTMAFMLGFTDGTSEIFTASFTSAAIPEARTWLMLGVVAVWALPVGAMRRRLQTAK